MTRGWRRYVRQRVLVNLKDRSAIRGVLLDGRGPLHLANAELVGENGRPLERPARIDGAALIDLANIAWVQLIPTEEL